jgi:hypothetical protein
MKVSFTCPSCNAQGSADSAYIGKEARCRQCKARFTIRDPDDPEPDVYALEGENERVAERETFNSSQEAVFVPARNRERSPSERPQRVKPPVRESSERTAKTASRVAERNWLVGVSVGSASLLILAGIALLAPGGLSLVGCVLLIVGSLMVVAGYIAGAYGAFSEDFLYGFFYLLIPPYTAYYMVTRWQDLWLWFACSTVGVGMVYLGTQLIRWSGTAA